MNSSNSFFGLKIGLFGQYPLNTLSAARRALFQSERVRSNRPKNPLHSIPFLFPSNLKQKFRISDKEIFKGII